MASASATAAATAATLGAATKSPFSSRRPLVLCARAARRRRASTASIDTLAGPDCPVAADAPTAAPSAAPLPKPNGEGKEVSRGSDWKKMSSKELGIKTSMITRPARLVLNGLRKKGYEVYLVGGCVRDLISKRIPKDFDIITTANLHEVKKTFSRCDIIGRRFPICHVHVSDSIVEVSSFKTYARKQNDNLAYFARKPDFDEPDYARWKNCLGRDFTINGLMFNPYSNLIYDYLGGMDDIKKAKVRTVIPAHISFQEDCARILRGIRIAARLGFKFSRETAHSVKDLSSLILRLDKGRILMEVNYMLAYGSAESSLRLLWKFGLMELLLPIQASYFVSQSFRRRDNRTNMLLALFSNLDRLLAPDKPCHSSLWIGLLAFHQALVCQPRDPLVVGVFALALHNGGYLPEAVKIARRITHPHDGSFPELSNPRQWDVYEDLVKEVVDLSFSVNAALSSMTDEHYVSQAMARYPQAPYSDLVFISLQMYLRACRIFECVGGGGNDASFSAKRDSKINYPDLSLGILTEVRHVFARVVFDTVYPPNLNKQECADPA